MRRPRSLTLEWGTFRFVPGDALTATHWLDNQHGKWGLGVPFHNATEVRRLIAFLERIAVWMESRK